MQATEDAGYMEAVPMPTVQHLLNGSIETLRQAIHDASAEAEPTRWVVSHLILGSALRLRATRAPEGQRARMYVEALGAFDDALTICAGKRQECASLVNKAGANHFGTQQKVSSG